MFTELTRAELAELNIRINRAVRFAGRRWGFTDSETAAWAELLRLSADVASVLQHRQANGLP